ncbi:MAG: dihydropteroate synthase [Rickettsiaceae bacterium]|nr:dihydropteroate synthase [Rickettsiaceae bacterium]MDD9337732.1 dihydropteroate synthase [Rickettsiaceae bacterium]
MIYISLGSNLGNRLDNLWESVNLIRKYCLSNIRCSIILETKAILPCSASADWDKPFLNMIVAGEANLSPTELLQSLQNIEVTIGRPRKYELWAPRIIDLDILFYNDLIINTENLIIPHPKLENRDFLKHLLALMGKEPWKFQPSIENSFIKSSVLNPRLVGIVNITKDSFSDGGNFYETNRAIEQVIKLVEDGASVIEIGTQSTRPKATIQPIESEYAKLDEVLGELVPIIADKKIDISVDTLHPFIAVNLIEKYHIRWINDVGGGFDDNTLRAIAKAGCKFCLMHSITVPASKNQIIPLNVKPIDYMIQWGKCAIQRLTKLGFTLENIVLDPGIGFGKTAYQNIEILRSIDQLKTLDSLIMIGHSRKSYIHAFSEESHAYARDIETIGVSLAIKDKVDFLRVHNVKDHMKALIAYHSSNNE